MFAKFFLYLTLILLSTGMVHGEIVKAEIVKKESKHPLTPDSYFIEVEYRNDTRVHLGSLTLTFYIYDEYNRKRDQVTFIALDIAPNEIWKHGERYEYGRFLKDIRLMNAVPFYVAERSRKPYIVFP